MSDPVIEATKLLPIAANPNAGPPGEPGWVIDATGCSWTSATQALVGGVFGLCGCGNPEQIGQDFLDVLNALHARWDTTESAKGKPTPFPERLAQPHLELILHLLDSAELAQHGGSVYGAWLTDTGRDWLAALNELHVPEEVTSGT